MKDYEKEITDKGLTAPRITPEDINNKVYSVRYHQFGGTTVTICLLTLRNGFTVVGESACASVENFDEAIGQQIAYDNAKEKIWQLEGYLLREELSKSEPERIGSFTHETTKS